MRWNCCSRPPPVLDVVLHREQLMDSATGHLVIAEEKYGDVPVFAHAVGVTHGHGHCSK